MRKIVPLGLFLFFSALYFLPSAFAEWKAAPGELFWIDVPDGWSWQGDAASVTITSPTGRQVVHIRYSKTEGLDNEEEARARVDEAREARRYELADRGGKTILKVERKVDGVYGLQTGFLVPTREGLNQATSIVFWYGGYLFDAYFEAPREFLRMKMEAIMDTLRFQKPLTSEEETVDEPASEEGEA